MISNEQGLLSRLANRIRRNGGNAGDQFGATPAVALRGQLRFLSKSARLEENRPPRLVLAMAWLSSAAILGFAGWAGFTNINEIARAPGEIVPTGFVQSVDHFDGGTVKSISVKEGQIVDQGDVLLVLDGTGAQEDLNAAHKKQWGLEVRAERLRAFVNERAPDFSRFGKSTDPVIAEQADIFNTMMTAYLQQKQVIDDQINQKRKVLTELGLRLETAKTNLATVNKVLEGRRELYNKALLPFSRLADTEKEMTTLAGDVKAIEEQQRQAQSAIEEFNARAASLQSSSRDSKFQELHKVNTDVAQNNEIIRKLEAKVARLNVKAPVHGIIKGLKINTIGSVVLPGATLMSVVPLDEDLVVEAKIPPYQIGHMKIGQPVRVKVSAYDSSRYGAVNGTLNAISATTFADASGASYYRGKVSLEKTYVGKTKDVNPVLPGMTVMAEIVTGEKTVLDYLLKPIHASLSVAFTER